MDHSFNRTSIWTTNGFLENRQRAQSPGDYSIHNASTATIAGQTTATTTRARISRLSDNDANSLSNGHNGSAITRYYHPTTKYPSTYHANLIGVQSKFRRKYYHKVLLGFLIFLIIILIIAIIILSIKTKTSTNICRSKECIRTAASLIYSMDEQTDPCEDFYKFTCGHWANDHPRPDAYTSYDWFRDRQAKVMRKLRTFLQSNITSEEPEAVTKAKTMYKACTNIEQLDERELEPLVNILRKFKLPILPSGLNITLPTETLSKYGPIIEFKWLDSLVMIKRNLGMDLLLGFDVFPDPKNRTVKRIGVGTPETESSLPFNNDDMHKLLHRIKRKAILKKDDNNDDDDVDDVESEEEESVKKTSTGLTAYIAYVTKLLEAYVSFLAPEISANELEASFENMALQAVKVARKVYKLKAAAENSSTTSSGSSIDVLYLDIADLQKRSDELIAPKSLPIWQPYIEMAMNGTKGAKALKRKNFKLITSAADIDYIQNLVEYLWTEPAVNIEYYVWLSTIEELVLHTTSEMRQLHSEYMRIVIGTEGSSSRSIYCTHGINSLMGMAVSFGLADDDFEKLQLPNVKRMLQDIHRAFNKLVRGTSWMDEPTKKATLEKSASMHSFIGYPEWLTNATELDSLYTGITVNASTHLENMVGVLYWQMFMQLDSFNEPQSRGWATAPSNVNAFHSFQENAITVPIAILKFPFYNLGLEALNYGSVGTILGHEVTHGFDDSGRIYDKDGNMVQWWSNETINEYVNRTECFVEQYNQYYLPDIGEYLSGELTLGENIADNGGMREAFYAYRHYVQAAGKEKMLLPGLEHYSHEQLFFIAFGNIWCETYTPAATRNALEDPHGPGKVRLKGVLHNSEEFAATFKCPLGSGMNPKRAKCRLW